MVISSIIVFCLGQTEMPRPQAYTELYFTDPPKESNPMVIGTRQKIPFTIHNHEHQTTTYHYRLIAVSTDNTEGQLGEGTVTLAYNHAQTINPTTTLPGFSDRTTLKVVLDYAGVSPGDNKRSPQTQSIHYWVEVAPEHVSRRSEHAS